MFELKDNKIIFGNLEIFIPQEFLNKIIKIYGTSTCGMLKTLGYVIGVDEKVKVKDFNNGQIYECVIIGETPIKTQTVFVREQLDVETQKIFMMASIQDIDPQLNWITTILDDGRYIRFCPFTFRYKICH